MNKTCREIVATTAGKVRKAGHKIEVDIPIDIEVDGYPGAFGQVITNFIDTALLHAFEGVQGGQMLFNATWISTDRVQVKFSDNGAGILADNLKRIFDPFFTTKLGRGGSGLGLNISYNIVTSLLGGNINVESEIGQGATFIIELPLKAPVQRE